ncbi:hypothetical protein ACVWYJ_006465 [Bradyrhizobium sp. USDA 4471]
MSGSVPGKIRAGLKQVDHDEAEHQRDKGRADEPAHGLGENTPELRARTHMGDAADQGRKHQRRDDHLDQAQEDHGDQVDGGGPVAARLRHEIVDRRAHDDAEHHRRQNVLRKPVRH